MLKDVYNNYKLNYKDYVLLIKSGNFYLSIDNDAIVMNNIFNYKVKESKNFIKIGFPILSLSKVITELDKLNVNYIIIDKEIITKQKNKTNNYSKYMSKNNYIIYLNRINNINEILKNNLNDNNISNVLDEVENILCKISF